MRRLALALVLALLCAAPVASSEPAAVPASPQPSGVPWPSQAWPAAEPGPDVDRAALEQAYEHAFRTLGRAGVRNTRALLAVHRGRIVAERYADGFDAQTRFHSWSMAKSVTQALVGILVRQGRLEVGAPAPVPEWHGADDPRRVVTLNHLLHMTSGLDNADGQGGEGFGAQMLFGDGAADQVAFASDVALTREPDTHWAYSTATSNIVAWIVQQEVGGTPEALLGFLHRELLDPLGMRRTIPEFDAAGHYLGGGFVWASAHDWARFGYLYLRDGVWEGSRILPEGWLDYTTTAAPAPNNSVHTAHFWINAQARPGQFEILPGAPPSAFCASGAYGQYVCMVPTHDLLVVRLGEMQGIDWPELRSPIVELIAAFPPLPEAP
ncbi:MAG: serine hydrolase [Deltaproteobacteria bacterium]|nr:serine hydrolase [Deltaproteobacteria bacterium]